jgi:phosphoribosyl 1,2-cyclic phosphate phosphodiesterase
MKVTVLGSGTSQGVPQIGCRCPACRSADPRDKRRRASVLIEIEGLTIVIDTGPDFRMQCLDAGIGRIDAVLYTHAHADHVHGIDDLKAVNNLMQSPVAAYAEAGVFERIRARFEYVFAGGRSDHGGFWRPEVTPHAIGAGTFAIGPIEITAFAQKHGRGTSWGFRIDRFAYSTDTDALDDAAFAALRGVELWIVDALRDRPHVSHSHLAQTVAWIERIGAARARLVHMNHEVTHADWESRLPEAIRPAFDGEVLQL